MVHCHTYTVEIGVVVGHKSEDARMSTHAIHRAATTVQRGSYSRTLCVHTPQGATVSHNLFIGSRFVCLPWNARLRLGLRPPLPFQLPGVAPPELLLRSIPQPSRPWDDARVRGEKMNPLLRRGKLLLGNETLLFHYQVGSL